jgi:hypothetical protein
MSVLQLLQSGDLQLLQDGGAQVLQPSTAAGATLDGTTFADASGNGNDGTYYALNASGTLSADGLVTGDEAATVEDPAGLLSNDVPFDPATFAGDFTIIGWFDDGGGLSPATSGELLQANGSIASVGASFLNDPDGTNFAMTFIRARDISEQSFFNSTASGIASLPAGRHMLVYRYTAASDNCEFLADNVAQTPSVSNPNPGALADDVTSGAVGENGGIATTWDEIAVVPALVDDADLGTLWDARDDFDTYAALMLALTPANYYHVSPAVIPPAPVPTVTSLTPPSGDEAGGNTVVIAGVTLADVSSVQFGGVDASFTVDSDTQITATAPPHDPGIVQVTAT